MPETNLERFIMAAEKVGADPGAFESARAEFLGFPVEFSGQFEAKRAVESREVLGPLPGQTQLVRTARQTCQESQNRVSGCGCQ